MCENCGCSGHHHEHRHESTNTGDGRHTHIRPDGSSYTHRHDESISREVAIGSAVLSANDRLAAENRGWFRARKVLALNLISSPGSGKTALLEKTLAELQKRNIPAAVIVGDQYGELDADRMRPYGAPVTQIETHSSCHLDASRIQEVLESAVPAATRILFIENVGNLVCPVAFDLGEAAKIALLSTPEGEEKPLKYPALFAAAKLVLITKCDLEKALDWNYELCVKNIHHINPDVPVRRVSAKTMEGMNDWISFLEKPRP